MRQIVNLIKKKKIFKHFLKIFGKTRKYSIHLKPNLKNQKNFYGELDQKLLAFWKILLIKQRKSSKVGWIGLNNNTIKLPNF